MIRKILGTSLLILLMAVACKKPEQNQLQTPPVNFSININNPAYISLKAIGGWVYVTGGSKGIILYRKEERIINAFDRHSPHNLQAGCVLSVDSSEIAAIDTCSNSRFLLSSGNPISGPATQPMAQYQTTFNGSELSVYN